MIINGRILKIIQESKKQLLRRKELLAGVVRKLLEYETEQNYIRYFVDNQLPFLNEKISNLEAIVSDNS